MFLILQLDTSIYCIHFIVELLTKIPIDDDDDDDVDDPGHIDPFVALLAVSASAQRRRRRAVCVLVAVHVVVESRLRVCDQSINQSINQASKHYAFVRPKVDQRAGQLSLPHVEITKTERQMHITPV